MVQPGEKGLSTALVDGGRVFLSTFVPAPAGATCAPTEGEGFVYVVNLKDATSTYNNRYYAVGSGIPSGAVTLGDSILVPGGGIDPVDPLDPNEELCEGNICRIWTERLYQIYWREPGIDDL